VGIALLWKPAGIGSQDCLARFKREVLKFKSARGKSEIGHTGTLDPFAEGVLLMAWQEGTKLLAPLQGLPKTYVAKMKFGATTTTLDSTSPEIFPSDGHFKALDSSFNAKAQAFLDSKLGSFDQIPPAFSAVHVNGRRAYELAREGKVVELKARKVSLISAEHLGFDPAAQTWTFRVEVSSGTYIRCLARDWGLDLSGFAGHLVALKRDAVGPFTLEEAQVKSETLCWKQLNINDFKGLFDQTHLNLRESELLHKHGRWTERPQASSSRKGFLAMSPDQIALGWIEADGRKIGRIFKSDPFEQLIDSF
jgi:tRNA pseudouridine55 synthase